MTYKPLIPRAEAGQPITDGAWNKIAEELERVLGAVFSKGYIALGSGIYPTDRDKDLRRYKLQDVLYRTKSGGTTADQLTYDGSDWVDDGIDKTILGDFTTGYWLEDDEIVVFSAGGSLYALPGGPTFRRAVLTSTLNPNSSATATITLFSGSWSASGPSITVYEDLGVEDPVDTGEVIFVNWEEHAQRWIVTDANCPVQASS